MAFYAFVTEPPLPRTQFDVQADVQADDEEAPLSDFDQALMNVLLLFPEAYRAVVEEMRRIRGERKRSP
jgi:hypothetical protein